MSKERELLERWLDDTIFEPEELDSLMEETKELLAQPEYKREPLSDGELAVWYSQHTWAMDKQEYIWGFKDAEKCHGIGGGECVAT